MKTTIERAPKSEFKMSYEDALMYCLFYEYQGKRGWRLPTADEFQESTSWYANEEQSKRKYFCSPVRG